MMFRLASLLLLASSCIVDAHRSLPAGVTCSSQFTSPETALTIPNPKVSWASYRIFTCDEPVFWLEAQADQNQNLAFTVTVPVIERFQDVRISVAFIGPGLPAITGTTSVPDQVRDYVDSTGLGIAVYGSPPDQPTCEHLTADLMKAESNVVDDRCVFYESFGGSNSWVVMDQEMVAAEAGLYKIAVFVEGGTTAKAAFACCDWPEDFTTNYPIPEPDCPFCGTVAEENPAWSSHFYEQKTMEAYAGFPPAASCADPESLNLVPADTQCPPVTLVEGDTLPASCVLGCGSDGECHSHNVFGECTHVLNWDLSPKFGEAPVSKLIIFKGDKVIFSYPPTGGSAHNLFEMADEASLDQCDFTNAVAVAGVEEVFIGHTVTFDEAGTFHFTCGIGCTGFPVEDQTGEEAAANELFNPSLRGSCHCSIGQKLTVEVKDSSEGLRCHDHEQILQEEAPEIICADGELIASAINAPDYGSMDETECAEICAQPFALDFMTGVTVGPCSARGYTKSPIQRLVRPPNSPQDIEVRVTNNADASNCHCHSYEEIACPEVEAPDDTLYAEHIAEIVEYCQGILDETEQACPYRCFQPMEVLHLHYLECESREVDPTYVAVNATNKCHIAARAPDGADCSVVELGRNPGGGTNLDTSNGIRAWSISGLMISFVLALPSLFM